MGAPRAAPAERRRLALVIDRPGWALGQIADSLVHLLADRYAAEAFFVTDFGDDRVALLRRLFLDRQFENIHFLWREPFLRGMRPKVGLVPLQEDSGQDADAVASALAYPVITFSVHDHLFLAPKDCAERARLMPFADGYSTVSQALFERYREVYATPPTCVTADGVDLDRFQPERLERFEIADRPLVVGWAGNPEWGAKAWGGDPKGLRSIVEPAIAALQAEGLDIRGDFAGGDGQMRPTTRMPSYYAGIDVLVCTSLAEGTPLPVLEAMACGVPVVSTDVGIVREALGPAQQRFILAERSPDALAAVLRTLYGDRPSLRALSQENLSAVLRWDRKATLAGWRNLLSVAEGQHACRKQLKQLAIRRILLAEANIGRLEKRISRCDEQVARLRADIAAKEATIKALRSSREKRRSPLLRLLQRRS